MIRRPEFPSTITISPPVTSEINFPKPTTAGISKAPAKIEVWLVLPPASVANACTNLVFNFAVSLGERSCARITTGSFKELRPSLR